jgi:hypothetical protein
MGPQTMGWLAMRRVRMKNKAKQGFEGRQAETRTCSIDKHPITK